MTRLDDARRREEPSPFVVQLVAETRDAVTATGGLRVLPDCTLDDCPPLDVLVRDLSALETFALPLAPRPEALSRVGAGGERCLTGLDDALGRDAPAIDRTAQEGDVLDHERDAIP